MIICVLGDLAQDCQDASCSNPLCEWLSVYPTFLRLTRLALAQVERGGQDAVVVVQLVVPVALRSEGGRGEQTAARRGEAQHGPAFLQQGESGARHVADARRAGQALELGHN